MARQGCVPVYKLILLGDVGVGKSSVLLRFRDETFVDDITATIGLDHFAKTCCIGNVQIKINLWDTAGLDRASGSMSNSYFSNAAAVLLVYDVTNSCSFGRLEKWLENATRYRSDVKKFVVGNKIDFNSTDHAVDKTTVSDFTERKNIPEDFIFRISAKTGGGFHEMFDKIAKVLKEDSMLNPSQPEEKPLGISDRLSEKRNWSKCKCS